MSSQPVSPTRPTWIALRLLYLVWVHLPALRAPVSRRLTRRFDRIADRWDSDAADDRTRMATLDAALTDAAILPRRALDIATGTGVAALSLAERFTDAWVEGIDAAPRMIELARANANQRGLPVRFAVADAAHTGRPDASFDLIVLLNGLPALHEIARLLTPGGAAVIAYTHGARTPFYSSRRTLRRLASRGGLRTHLDGTAGGGEYIVVARPIEHLEIKATTATNATPTLKRAVLPRPGERAYCLIGNAGDRRRVRTLSAVAAELHGLGCSFRVESTESPEEAAGAARAAAERGEIAVAVGGDGCVHHVLQGVAGRGVLGIVPAGSGNDGARALGVPLDRRRACELLVYGSERTVDLGVVGARRFLTIACTGIDAAVLGALERSRLRGRAAYPLAALRSLAGWRPARFELECDGETRSVTGYTVVVANGDYYGGGMRVAPGAVIDDGRLCLVTIADFPRRRFAASMRKVYGGTHIDLPAVEASDVTSVVVTAEPAMRIFADGEPVAQTPATISLAPRSLRVIAPASDREESR